MTRCSGPLCMFQAGFALVTAVKVRRGHAARHISTVPSAGYDMGHSPCHHCHMCCQDAPAGRQDMQAPANARSSHRMAINTNPPYVNTRPRSGLWSSRLRPTPTAPTSHRIRQAQSCDSSAKRAEQGGRRAGENWAHSKPPRKDRHQRHRENCRETFVAVTVAAPPAYLHPRTGLGARGGPGWGSPLLSLHP